MSWIIYTAKPEGEGFYRSSDLDTVMNLLYARVEWLREQGIDQWSTWPRWRPEVEHAIRGNRVWILYEEGSYTPVGTMTVSYTGDPGFWTATERETPALYVSKLATRPDYAGKGLGRLMLDFALYKARSERLREVRMDVWRSNPALHRYYEQHGWTHVRTVDAPERHSGVLLTRRVEPVRTVNLPPDDLTIRPPLPPINGYDEYTTNLLNPEFSVQDAQTALDG